MKKRYYSSYRDYHTVRRPKIIFRLVNIILRKSIGKNEVIWLTDKPDEPAIFVANHTRTYAPLAMYFCFDRKSRPWGNGYTITYCNGVKLFYNKIAYDMKPRWLTKILAYFFMPLINLYFRSLEIIPVFHDIRIKQTFKKTTETLNEGLDVIIYPEKNIEPPYPFVNALEVGFVHLAPFHHRATGKAVKFYPVYVCQDLKKILVGEPIQYDPEIDIRAQRETIAHYLTDKINELGSSLPDHKPSHNKSYPPEVNKFNF